MTTPQQDLYALLSNSSAVTALVGTRITPGIASQNTAVPYISYFLPSTVNLNALDTNVKIGANSSIQIDCWANSPDEATAVGDAVEAALTTGYVTFRREEERDPETERFRSLLDWKVWK
jgi:hypothetical protein